MKRYITLLFILITIIVATACSSGKPTNAERTLSKVLSIDLTDGIMVENEDTHGGFHGDGHTFISMTFENPDDIITQIQNNSLWKELPLTSTLASITYGTVSYPTEDSVEVSGPYAKDKDGNLFFPEIENGYYYFEDRHPQTKYAYNSTLVLERTSLNFTIAIFDTDYGKLYYYDLDT